MAVGGAGIGLKKLHAVPRPGHRMIVLAAILLVASLLRLYRLGQSSLWYDEVVTMRLAQTQSPLSSYGCSMRSTRPVLLFIRYYFKVGSSFLARPSMLGVDLAFFVEQLPSPSFTGLGFESF